MTQLTNAIKQLLIQHLITNNQQITGHLYNHITLTHNQNHYLIEITNTHIRINLTTNKTHHELTTIHYNPENPNTLQHLTTNIIQTINTKT